MGNKEYYQKNKEKILARQKKKREENIDEARKKQREYYHNNKKSQSARMKEYHENNREKLLQKQHQYRKDNIDVIREKEREYKKTFNGIMTRRISSWKYQAGLKETPERKVLIFYRWYYSKKCELCLKPYKTPNQKCMEHHHSSGHFRSICCSSCNSYFAKMDRKKQSVLLELHRYFLMNP